MGKAYFRFFAYFNKAISLAQKSTDISTKAHNNLQIICCRSEIRPLPQISKWIWLSQRFPCVPSSPSSLHLSSSSITPNSLTVAFQCVEHFFVALFCRLCQSVHPPHTSALLPKLQFSFSPFSTLPRVLFCFDGCRPTIEALTIRALWLSDTGQWGSGRGWWRAFGHQKKAHVFCSATNAVSSRNNIRVLRTDQAQRQWPRNWQKCALNMIVGKDQTNFPGW